MSTSHEEAENFLETALQAGALTSKHLQDMAAEAGIALRTLRRAQSKLGIVAFKESFRGQWLWRLPDFKDLHGYTKPLPPIFTTRWFKKFAPYCFRRLHHTGERDFIYLPLNRSYKPIGFAPGWVKYEDCAELAMYFTVDIGKLKGLWVSKTEAAGEEQYWLYDDWPITKFDYFERLAKVMAKGEFIKDSSALLNAMPRIVSAEEAARRRPVRFRKSKSELHEGA